MLELLFLLLPIAAGYGWYMGHRSAKNDKQRVADRLSHQYVKGINLLLSEDADQAVEHFIELLELDDDTIDTHLALGNLFRRRGEVDRAISLHESLIERTNLTVEQRNLACMQLANDFMSAGFLDRAETIFIKLIDEPIHRKNALSQLLSIYQQLHDWDKAIRVGQTLVKLGSVQISHDVAQFYCELGILQQAEPNDEAAIKLFKKALSIDKNCVRASILLGQVEFAQQNYKKATSYFENVLAQDADFISETLPFIVVSYQERDKLRQLIKFLKKCVEVQGSTTAEIYLAKFIAKRDGDELALSVLTEYLTKNPTIRGFSYLIDYYLKKSDSDKAKESLVKLQELIFEQQKLKPKYRCHQCGFTAHSLFWQCPSCHSWGKIKPIKGLDGD